jgi:hypothetical protein
LVSSVIAGALVSGAPELVLPAEQAAEMTSSATGN